MPNSTRCFSFTRAPSVIVSSSSWSRASRTSWARRKPVASSERSVDAQAITPVSRQRYRQALRPSDGAARLVAPLCGLTPQSRPAPAIGPRSVVRPLPPRPEGACRAAELLILNRTVRHVARCPCRRRRRSASASARACLGRPRRGIRRRPDLRRGQRRTAGRPGSRRRSADRPLVDPDDLTGQL